MKITLSVISDTIFFTFLTFIVGFILLNYYIPTPYSIVIPLFICIPFAMLYYNKLKNKDCNKKLKGKEQKEKQTMIFNLNLLSLSQTLLLFEKALKNRNVFYEKKRNCLVIKEQKIALFFCFSFDPITKTEIVKIFNSPNRQDVSYIFSDNFSTEILSFINRFNGKIVAVDGIKTYNFLKSTNCLPKTDFSLSEEKKKAKFCFNAFFDAKKAKRFFTFGLIFLAMSFFVTLKIYYLICGTLMIIFAILCKLFAPSTNE